MRVSKKDLAHGRPYVSHKKLCDSSRPAMPAAIEIYNKPDIVTPIKQVVAR